MRTFTFNKNVGLFSKNICCKKNIFFHGTHSNFSELIESEGIKRKKYPQPVSELIEEYTVLTKKIGITHALWSTKFTYEREQIVFLSKVCSSVMVYCKNIGGERLHTLKISIDGLDDLINNPATLNKKIREHKLRLIHGKESGMASLDEIESDKMALDIFKNIEQYKPLLEKSFEIIECYENLFYPIINEGVVYAIDGAELNIEGGGFHGFTTSNVPIESIIAKSTFDLTKVNYELYEYKCRECKNRELNRKKSI